MPTRAEAAAGIWQDRLERMSRQNARQLLALWDSLGGYDWSDADLWRATARPLVIGAAEASLDLTAAYTQAAMPARSVGTASPLIVSDAGARLYDPFDLLTHMLGQGYDWTAAVASGRSGVDKLARDTVWRSARQGVAEMVTGTQWVRRLDGNACDWCVSLSGVVWDSAHAATFGHDNCGCLPVPLDAIGTHNETIARARRIESPKDYSVQQQASRIRRQERTALRRRQSAIDEARTETDPARRERLSIREQEWETRAERAAERLRLLEAATPIAA